MDVNKTLRELYAEKKQLDRTIQRLEARLQELEAAQSRPAPRRGRKNMSEAEREEVSRRMKEYWASRRSQGPGGGGTPGAAP